MSGLKKKARKSLITNLCALFFAGFGLLHLVRHHDEVSILNDFPKRMIVASVLILFGICVAVGRFVFKKRLLRGLDERECVIYENADMVTDSVFASLCVAGFLGLVGWFGPRASIPAYVPLLVLGGFALLVEIAKTVFILIWLKMESPND